MDHGLRSLLDQCAAGAADRQADAGDEDAVVASIGARHRMIDHAGRALGVGRDDGALHVAADHEGVAAESPPIRVVLTPASVLST